MGSINPSARLSTPEATRAGLGDLPSLPAISPGKPGAGGPGDAAGTAGPDGITGPHSNIWLKIQNRYQVVRPTLIP